MSASSYKLPPHLFHLNGYKLSWFTLVVEQVTFNVNFIITLNCFSSQGKVASRSNSTQSFDEALRDASRSASGATSPSIPENKALP